MADEFVPPPLPDPSKPLTPPDALPPLPKIGENAKKFKGFKAVGRARREGDVDASMSQHLDDHLEKIKKSYAEQGKTLDTDKVKQYMALFKFAADNWTKPDEKAAIDRERERAGMSSPVTDKSLEGIDVQALIRELINRKARGMEKVPEGPMDPEMEALLRGIMENQPRVLHRTNTEATAEEKTAFNNIMGDEAQTPPATETPTTPEIGPKPGEEEIT